MRYLERGISRRITKEAGAEGSPDHPFSHYSIHQRQQAEFRQVLGGHACFWVSFWNTATYRTEFADKRPGDKFLTGMRDIHVLRPNEVIIKDPSRKYQLVFDANKPHVFYGYGSVPARIEQLNGK